ncbi:hypothetical protein SAMN05444920_107457 [Nonomuraea solani]|uniref:Uncharacterized protein n=1 Tax=Nonomuraea solani TaxID=1144553 RepID=A0A1H6E3D2_9ACTN|nr:hypothetical protein [Nonomuraea solani]SEG92130.1 hypothetical protein SAMN05444920_107457 [Nonomuraea solani]
MTVTYSRVQVSAAGGPGGTMSSLSFEPVPETEVGRDWQVWDAKPVKEGHVRLLVTPDRLPKNPLYN